MEISTVSSDKQMVMVKLTGEPVLVPPARDTPKGMHFLSNLDYSDMVIYTFFPYKHSKGNENAAKVIKKALSEVLVHYYPLAGRLGVDDEDGGRFAVDCTGDGAVFVEADADCELGYIDLSKPDHVTRAKLVYMIAGAKSTIEIPPLMIQMTRFTCGGFVLGMSWNHYLGDGIAAIEFVNSWAETARGLPLSVPPFLDRTLLKARVPLSIDYHHSEYDDLKDISSSFNEFHNEPIVFEYAHFTEAKIRKIKHKISLPIPFDSSTHPLRRHPPPAGSRHAVISLQLSSSSSSSSPIGSFGCWLQMKCKQHPCDLSSSIGVCASCLRNRLSALVAAQSHLHHQSSSSSSPWLPRSHSRPASSQAPCKSESNNLAAANHHHPPLLFPRSVSPYVARRKSHGHEDGDGDGIDDSWSHHHLRFLTTPQLGPTYSSSTASTCQRKYAKLSLLANFFRSRSDKLRNPDLVPASAARDSAQPSSSSWFSSIFHSRRKNKHQPVPESLPRRRRGRGMSPADFEECDPTGICDDPWDSKRTPTSAGRRGKTRNMNNSGNNNPAAGFAFCLSPLVRASPNPHWNQKGTLPPDLGEVRVAVKPNLSTAASFCANRSRKLADFGRR